MNSTINYIRQRLSLRKPLADALEVASHITDELSLQKPPADPDMLKMFIAAELAKVKQIVPSIKSFDRDFPSLAFSIATGIGKTRLMGAIVAYLYLKKGIKHFFILAPNLTLYEKLVRDFSDTSYSKYVFKGISEFVTAPPKIVTGEYNERSGSPFSNVEINIFNISKFNKDSKEGVKGAPRMRRLSEYLGQSYFEYLASLPDLVILMDEAHRYHADASKRAINELRPILGLEMTATPFDEKGKAFKNILFEYNLAEALADGKYVKKPAIAKARNFNKDNYMPEEIEIVKLEDGITVHEKTKLAIELYARQNNLPVVKPFILVACRDINHAKEVEDLLQSERIFHGVYKGKVLRIDSSSKKDEEIERQFLALESPDNEIEIVVHVNMLKEGWDVNNLYTIIPLRASNAAILIEQTIGRGLRLPYGGQRTGNNDVDTLTVIAHDNFQKVIEAASDKNSVLHRVSFVELDEPDERDRGGKVEITPTSTEQKVIQRLEKVRGELDEKARLYTTQAVRAVEDALVSVAAEGLVSCGNLQSEEVIQRVRQQAEKQICESVVKDDLFGEREAAGQIAQINELIRVVIEDYKKNVIEIPRLIVEQQSSTAIFEDFDLDTSAGYRLTELHREIIRQGLHNTTEFEIIEGKSGSSKRPAAEQLLLSLIDYDDVDYDEISDLLYKLIGQAIEALKCQNGITSNDELNERMHPFRKSMAENIYKQMKDHYTIVPGEFKINKVLPFSKILDQPIVEYNWGTRDFHDPIPSLKSVIIKYVYVGFKKSYYTKYKFDSSTELDFAFILETNSEVLKWLRPVPNQFNIYWDNGAKRYEPDFIVETNDSIYMCEIKAEKDMNDADVLAKAESAKEFCRRASEYTKSNGGKPWRYIIIPHTLVDRGYSFNYLLSQSNLF